MNAAISRDMYFVPRWFMDILGDILAIPIGGGAPNIVRDLAAISICDELDMAIARRYASGSTQDEIATGIGLHQSSVSRHLTEVFGGWYRKNASHLLRDFMRRFAQMPIDPKRSTVMLVLRKLQDLDDEDMEILFATMRNDALDEICARIRRNRIWVWRHRVKILAAVRA